MKAMSRIMIFGLCALGAASSAFAQQPAANAASKLPPITTVRVDVVLTRVEGDKELGKSPFSLLIGVGAARSNVASVRAGIDVPSGTVSNPNSTGRTETAFKTIGTQIDASVFPNGEVFGVDLSIADTAVYDNGDSSSRLAAARATMQAANLKVERQKELFAKNLVTQANLDKAKADAVKAAQDVSDLWRASTAVPAQASETAFRTFTMRNVLYLRDGQTQQSTLASDRTTGQTVKVDVTLTVVK